MLPDQLVNYSLNAEYLHQYGVQPATFNLLTRAAELQVIPAAEIAALPEPRQRIIQTVAKLSRSANFRTQVLTAYGNRCAVTRAQLRLVDAAHILPVGAPTSTDHVSNGLALAPTYHRAYDNGLIYLDEAYEMRINPARANELRALYLDGGLAGFSTSLGVIHLPPDPAQRPRSDLIRAANAFRRI
jgi:putative restriction endonuclease